MRKKGRIPGIPYWLLENLYKSENSDAYCGDIKEEFCEVQKCRGRTKARQWIWHHAIAAIPRCGMHFIIWRTCMLKNYFKITLRSFFRHKGYTLINTAGLAIGIACCTLIMLWVQDELSFDRFHANAENLYVATFSNGSITTPTALSDYLKSEYPEVIHASRYSEMDKRLLRHKDKKIYETGGLWADPDFLKMFTLHFLKGGIDKALDDPKSILLSEKLARKLFGNTDPFNKILTFSTATDLKVTGIFKDYPANSHMHFEYIIPISNELIRSVNLNTWDVNNIRTYVHLRPNTPVHSVDDKITDVVESHRPQDKRELFLQPITRLHLNPFNDTGGTLQYVYLFSALAFFILIIACINFINLTTAQSSNRAKEVGVRKTVGACRTHLVRQFFGESLFLTIIASALAIVLVVLFLPMFNHLTNKAFNLEILIQQKIILSVFGIVFITAILAGSYPSFVLSRFQTVKVLKGNLISDMRGKFFRRGLVVMQFSLSILLVIGSLMIFRQVHYLRERDVGFDRNNIVYFGIGSRFRQNIDTIKTELLSHSHVLGVTLIDVAPYRWQSNAGFGDVHWEGKTNQQVKMVMTSVDYDFLDTFGLKMDQGRFFSKEYSTDAGDAFVVNQAAVRAMEMEDPIGKRLRIWEMDRRIIGVVEDYNFESLHNKIIPMTMMINPNWYSQACIRISSHNIPDTLAFIKNEWEKIYPELPFEYYFLDETIQDQYHFEQAMGRIVTVFTILALFISCLGIFGLSLYTVERRTKEIGIRKVLGATVPSIFRQISKEFLCLVIIANVMIWPFAYFIINRWLESFAYRISLEWWAFVLTGILVLAVSLLTVSWQIMRAATVNPADSLRYE